MTLNDTRDMALPRGLGSGDEMLCSVNLMSFGLHVDFLVVVVFVCELFLECLDVGQDAPRLRDETGHRLGRRRVNRCRCMVPRSPTEYVHRRIDGEKDYRGS